MKDKASNKFESISPRKFTEFNDLIESLNIKTICNSGLCPNRPECFERGHLAFLILGDICTRNCGFCAVNHGTPEKVDLGEPEKISKAIKLLGIKHAVITSVTRDDLDDGGAEQFVRVIDKLKKNNPTSIVEVLIPDFKGNKSSFNLIINAKPDIVNHNIECCKSCFKKLRPLGDYNCSLNLLKYFGEKNRKEVLTKSGFMVGVGESMNDINSTLNDLKKSKVDIITIGQYLPPRKDSFKLSKMYTKEEFSSIEDYAKRLGFKEVYVGRNVRSSYVH
ncbi:MAG: lipoyl synthase [Candidatus Pacearchaeota archaeon]|jgi:lipoic acid synthetase